MVSGKLVVTKFATPEALSVPAPKLVVPSMNTTVPVGVPPAPVTVAVKVTAPPAIEGFCEEVSVLVVAKPA